VGIISIDQHDAFVSYARDDNLLCDDAVRQFRISLKSRFEAEMRRRLAALRRVEADIFMDEHGLPANGSLPVELERAVEHSIFLFIFIGQSYPQSIWCSRELATFVGKFEGRRDIALERTFLIILERGALSQNWGNALENPERPIYEEFFDSVTGATIPFVLEGPDGQACHSPRFTGRLRRIVDTMVSRALPISNSYSVQANVRSVSGSED
jgi:hypothetical protein